MGTKKYITQITAAELDGMLAAGKMRAGRGIKVERDGDSFVVSLDDKAIVEMIWCFIKAGQVRPTSPCSVANTIKETRDLVCTEPSFYP